MRVDKNIMFFLPFNYFFQRDFSDLAIKNIISYINSDLKILLEYRKSKISKDTYIAFVSGMYFVLAKEENNNLIFSDKIKLKVSSLYQFLDNSSKHYM